MHNSSYQRRGHRRRKPHFIPAIVIVISVYLISMLAWPLQSIAAEPTLPKPTKGKDVKLAWPSGAQSALRGIGYGELAHQGTDTPTPMASITKLVTALVVLESKPLDEGQEGPLITFSESDARLYNEYLAQEGVVGPVTPGQSISQYDLLQIMLVASANNYADTLAIWAYGSIDSYLVEANKYLDSQGLTSTTVADAPGFSEQSVSTARDLVKLGEIALTNTLIRPIVAKPSTTVEGYGTFYSTNLLINEESIIGIKTGTTDEAGNCLLYAAMHNIAGKEIIIIGATLNAPDRLGLAREAFALLEDSHANFEEVTVAASEQQFGTFNTPWGNPTGLNAQQDISTVAWAGHDKSYELEVDDVYPGSQPSGTAVFKSGSHMEKIALQADEAVSKPSTFWRITHPHRLLAKSY